LQGYWWALNRFNWIFQTDSDRQTIPSDFYPLWDARHQVDFLFGNRQVRGDGPSRWFVSKVLRVVILLIFQCYVVDANVPFRLMKKEPLIPLLEKVPEDIFLINSYLSILIAKRHTIKWFPITFRARERGENSINIPKISKLAIRIIKEFYALTFNQKG
jgi:hypothetical protein